MTKTIKSLAHKRSNKRERERNVLLGLVEFYLKTGKPVGSITLKEAGFENLSSATIRNYFANLEEDGLLKQQHISGGRIPTEKAIRQYINEYLHAGVLDEKTAELIHNLSRIDTKEIASYLQTIAEQLSLLTNCAVFLSSPRFDQDFVTDLKLIPIDATRCLGVIVTDFGTVQSEILNTSSRLSSFSAKRIETYFQWRLKGLPKPENLEPAEERVAQDLYNELMLRYIVGYTHSINEEVLRTGFSRLLIYPELQEPSTLAGTLGLFENLHGIRLLLRDTKAFNDLRCWIGEDLNPFNPNPSTCAVITVPYSIHGHPVGGMGVLGPIRLPYRSLFGILRAFSEMTSECLTRNIYKHKIQFRQPETAASTVSPLYLTRETRMLIENKS